MVIHADDRIADVLKRNEALIDVFAGLSPAFERLRNPGMRKVMSRLVTVRQAARLAGVDLDTLLSQLNGSPDSDVIASSPIVPPDDTSEPGNTAGDEAQSLEDRAQVPKPAALDAIAPEHIVTADVRDELRAGREPFSLIMAALRSVPEGGALCVRAIFEPVPLYAVMKRQGMAHHTERLADDDWIVWFYSDAVPVAVPAPSMNGAASPDTRSDEVIVLDVRGLEPPEPMLRTLAALEAMPEGATLVQINVRVPQFLLPLLDERGFSYEIREQDDELVRLFIRRNSDAAS